MLKYIQRFHDKLYKKSFYKGYMITFDGLSEKPNFQDYQLKDIGVWMKKSGDHWLCTSKITNLDEFTQLFLEKTKLPSTKITIEERHFPSLTGM